MATVAESLLTAEEFARRPRRNEREELVLGRIIMAPPPGFEHGSIQTQLAVLIQPYLNQHQLGRIVGEVGLVVGRNPDTVRGPDVAYFSFDRIPAGTRPRGYPGVLPEVAFEIRSPSDRWNEVLDKVQEYLTAGILAIVIDPGPREVHIFEPDQPVRVLTAADVFELPGLWPGLAFPVLDLFL